MLSGGKHRYFLQLVASTVLVRLDTTSGNKKFLDKTNNIHKVMQDASDSAFESREARVRRRKRRKTETAQSRAWETSLDEVRLDLSLGHKPASGDSSN